MTHYGPVTPYNLVNIGSRNGSVAGWHQVFTLINVDFFSVRSPDIHLRAVLWEVFEISITEMYLNITHLKLQSLYLMASEFRIFYCIDQAFLSIVSTMTGIGSENLWCLGTQYEYIH